MLPADPTLVLVAALTFLLAGFVKGVVGLGLPTIAMGLLTIVMAPVQAAALLIVPTIVTNVWQLVAGPRFGPLLRRLWPMMAGIVAGTLAAGGLLQKGGGGLATMGLGVALVVYAVVGLSAVRFSVPPRAEIWLGPLVGGLTGAITAATGVAVIPSAPYLASLGLAKEDLVQALGLSFTVSTFALAVTLVEGGALGGSHLGASLLALVPALIGIVGGGWVRGRVSEPLFRRCFFLGLLVLGAYLALKPLI